MSQKVFKKLNHRNCLSNFHRLILTFFKTQITQKKVSYSNYKEWEESRFLEDLKSTELSLKTGDPKENYNFITAKFLESHWKQGIV